jgi:hypothetical protein
MTTPMPPDQMSAEDRVNDIVDSINAEPYLKHGGLMLVAKGHDHIRAIRREENEACAKVVEAQLQHPEYIAERIRARLTQGTDKGLERK